MEDPAVATHTVANIRDAVYLLVQLASREFVAGVSLYELLAGRDTMTRFLEADVTEKARRVGSAWSGSASRTWSSPAG